MLTTQCPPKKHAYLTTPRAQPHCKLGRLTLLNFSFYLAFFYFFLSGFCAHGLELDRLGVKTNIQALDPPLKWRSASTGSLSESYRSGQSTAREALSSEEFHFSIISERYLPQALLEGQLFALSSDPKFFVAAATKAKGFNHHQKRCFLQGFLAKIVNAYLENNIHAASGDLRGEFSQIVQNHNGPSQFFSNRLDVIPSESNERAFLKELADYLNNPPSHQRDDTNNRDQQIQYLFLFQVWEIVTRYPWDEFSPESQFFIQDFQEEKAKNLRSVLITLHDSKMWRETCQKMLYSPTKSSSSLRQSLLNQVRQKFSYTNTEGENLEFQSMEEFLLTEMTAPWALYDSVKKNKNFKSWAKKQIVLRDIYGRAMDEGKNWSRMIRNYTKYSTWILGVQN